MTAPQWPARRREHHSDRATPVADERQGSPTSDPRPANFARDLRSRPRPALFPRRPGTPKERLKRSLGEFRNEDCMCFYTAHIEPI